MIAPGYDALTVQKKEAICNELKAVLASIGDKKINVIKEVRAITGLGLKEAKELEESAPKAIKAGAKKEEALRLFLQPVIYRQMARMFTNIKIK